MNNYLKFLQELANRSISLSLSLYLFLYLFVFLSLSASPYVFLYFCIHLSLFLSRSLTRIIINSLSIALLTLYQQMLCVQAEQQLHSVPAVLHGSN